MFGNSCKDKAADDRASLDRRVWPDCVPRPVTLLFSPAVALVTGVIPSAGGDRAR